jgi:hypothetical protein
MRLLVTVTGDAMHLIFINAYATLVVQPPIILVSQPLIIYINKFAWQFICFYVCPGTSLSSCLESSRSNQNTCRTSFRKPRSSWFPGVRWLYSCSAARFCTLFYYLSLTNVEFMFANHHVERAIMEWLMSVYFHGCPFLSRTHFVALSWTRCYAPQPIRSSVQCAFFSRSTKHVSVFFYVLRPLHLIFNHLLLYASKVQLLSVSLIPIYAAITNQCVNEWFMSTRVRTIFTQ